MIDIVGDLRQNGIVDQQRAELYMRIYKYAAQDFVNGDDMEIFVTALLAWATSIETRMTTLSANLQTHTHPITPHIHPIPVHSHVIPPHIHIAPPYGGPTSPMALTTSPGGPGASSLNDVLNTLVPTNPSALIWPSGTIPNKYINTTGVIANVGGTKVIISESVIGSSMPHQRRMLIAPEAAIPTIPPYLTPIVV